jgi:diguanylate cyclase (GGDEF)-like protein/PAS domain S-box-containing protein
MVAGTAAAVVGLIVLVGWIVGSDPVKSMLLGPLAMKANTAVCFVLMGVGVILLSDQAASRRWLAVALIGAATSIALLTLSQYLTGADLEIDQLLFRDTPVRAGTVGAGRMSPLTTIAFSLLALGAVSAARAPRIVLPLSVAALALSALNVFSFVFDASIPPALAGYSQMALNTAIAMVILAVGVLGLLGPTGPLLFLARRTPSASLLRRVLAALIVVPLLMALLTQAGQRAGLYDAGYGTALRLVAIMLLGTVGVLRWARWTERLELNREAAELERDRFFEQSLEMLAVLSADGRFRRANAAWQRTLGYSVDELIGRPVIDLVHPDDLEATTTESRRQRAEGTPIVGFQNRLRHRDGGYRWLEWTSTMSPDGSIAFSVARDVTDRRRLEERRANRERRLENRNEQLSERALRDPLTGLHNRRYFDRAVVALERRWRRPSASRPPAVAVLILDLDHFGKVNKDYGHQAGDAILRSFSELLKQRFRDRDLVVRYGGEEFVAVLEGVTVDGAIGIADGIREAFERLPIEVGTDAPIHVTVSGGCSQLGADGDVSAALSQADVWLSQAKRAGRNLVVGL